MAELKTHYKTDFISESQCIALPGVNSRDKAYKAIRRGVKFIDGKLETACSGKEVL